MYAARPIVRLAAAAPGRRFRGRVVTAHSARAPVCLLPASHVSGRKFTALQRTSTGAGWARIACLPTTSAARTSVIRANRVALASARKARGVVRLSSSPAATATGEVAAKEGVDWGKLLLNVGAVAGLSGFMMRDVLYLRSLAICSSLCGIAFNITRMPRQWNAVAWGVVFAATNTTMIYLLLQERSEIKFTVDQINLYRAQFQPFGVSEPTFYKMCKLGEWHTGGDGSKLVEAGKPLDSVIVIVRGSAAANDPKTGKSLYKYTGGGSQGGVIGGTALVDGNVTKRTGGYPRDVVATEKTAWVEWPVDALHEIMAEDGTIQSAFMASLYVDLIHALRRFRKGEDSKMGTLKGDNYTALDSMSVRIARYEEFLRAALRHGSIHPADKKAVRELAKMLQISAGQHEQVLGRVGWTNDEYDDGALHHHVHTMKDVKRATCDADLHVAKGGSVDDAYCSAE